MFKFIVNNQNRTRNTTTSFVVFFFKKIFHSFSSHAIRYTFWCKYFCNRVSYFPRYPQPLSKRICIYYILWLLWYLNPLKMKETEREHSSVLCFTSSLIPCVFSFCYRFSNCFEKFLIQLKMLENIHEDSEF